MPARGLANHLMIQSSTFLVRVTAQKCALVTICSLLFFMSPFIDSIQQQFSCLAILFLCFVSNSQVGQMDPESTLNFLFNVSFT